MRVRIAVFVIVFVTALGGLCAACGGSEAQDDVEVDLGVVLTLSGPSSIYGLSSQKGIELALAEINDDHTVAGVTIKATVKDDGGDAQTAAGLFQDLIDDDVDALAGPTLSNSAVTADPLAAQKGIPVLAISNTATGITAIGDSIFRIPLTDAVVVPGTIHAAMASLNAHSAMLLYAGDEAFALSTAEVMRSAATAQGLQLIGERKFKTTDTDFTTVLQAVQALQPDLLLIAALSTPTDALIVQARDMGLPQHIICGNQCNSPAFLQATGNASQGLLVGATWNIGVENAESRAFVEAFRARFNSDPDQWAAQAYTAIYLLADAARRAATDDPGALAGALRETHDRPTPLGAFSFDVQREPMIEPVIQIVENGTFVIFS